MSIFTRFKFFLWYFGRFKVAMIGYLKPRLIKLTDSDIVICLPLKRRSRNHLNSMYFGALAVGADLAGGLHGFYHAERAACKTSLVFKSFQAQFLKRPESDVYFVCSEGESVKKMIEDSKASGERINKPLIIKAYTNYLTEPEEVADFILELSIKVVR
ncbi:aromatic compounds catabolism [Legionella moravica]|uniref:Aromatic compounds catabolism n=1 Tax=Legionella moravica TaxID=39962 RepID=A0A378JVL8_9GAMM|nr:hypothetical protein [Legionella moravica]KTD32513.1 aromatic compounds catabolism [Legionella moravica]STX61418.1 aromatic compounds catabolism [Legionella moravica]